MGVFGGKSNGQTRATTDSKGRSITTAKAKVKADRKEASDRAAAATALKWSKGKKW